jgi:uncharacterized protein (TIGR02996 family)
MSTAVAFLETILADPDDNTARLVFADWLEEHGDPRGEFIRTQIALTDPRLDNANRVPLLLRAAELRAQHEEGWVEEIRELISEWTFERGFIERITIDAASFLRHADALFRHAPIRHVKFRDLGAPASPSNGSALPITKIAGSPHLERLLGLELTGNGLGDSGTEILATEARFTRLDMLDLGMNFIELDGIKALAESRKLANLRTLVLDHNPVHDMGIYALASCSQLAKLRTLRLQFCDVTPLGARYLAEAASLPCLEALDVSHNELGDDGVRVLARARKLGQLRELRLQNCGVGALGVRLLLDSNLAGRLTCLDLRSNPIARTQQQVLQERFGAGVCVL